MNTPNSPLAAANDRRRQAALSAAHNAIARLQRQGAPLTFGSVAKTASVSRAWLYREPTIRELIRRARSASERPVLIRSPQRASTDSLRQINDALHDQLTRLKQENHDLREQLARKLGEQRTQRTRRTLGGDMSTPSTPTTTSTPPH